MKNQFNLSYDDIDIKKNIGEGPNSTTHYSLLGKKRYICASKVLKDKVDSFNENYQKYIQMLTKINHQGIIPFLGFCNSTENVLNRNILVFKYATNLSLQQILDHPSKEVPWFDLSRKFILIYGIAKTMEFLHKNNIFHGRLTSSNVLIDENYEPKISDIYFSLMLSKTDLSIENLKKYNLYNYIDPYTFKKGEINGQSDVYSFAIIALQILSGSNNIYDEEDVEQLINKIKTENLQPIIPSHFPDEIKDLLINCLNEDPFLRPNFKNICEKLDSIISSIPEIPPYLFNEYKEKIETSDFNKNTLELDVADEYDTDSELFEAEDQDDNENNENNEFIRLINDPYFDKPKIDLEKVINEIENSINKTEEFTCDNPEEIEKLNFIQTDGAKKRLQKLVDYIKVNVPVLLEGPTGTSKTLSSEIVCRALHLELIRFNLSSETKTQDLIGRYVGDENSWAGISMMDGPFFEAFSKGKVLLLDEINLAPPSVLQCIEEALDSGYLSIEIPGRPLKSIKKHENFRLIATQNPNKGLFANKRQNLGLKFYSRFQVISFPSFTGEELEEIGLKLAHNFGFNNEMVVKELVAFHKEWSDYREKTNDPQCFTVREIAATVHALGRNESIYDTVMTIYGARYQKELKDELNERLRHYPHLFEKPSDYQCPQFPGCYMNESLKSATKSIFFSFKNHRHVILTGKDGCGKTQLALWASEFYNNTNKLESQDNDESFFCVCTEEIKVADLVGHSSPSGKSDGTNELIVWQDGFLTKAIKQGKCCVLESLDEAPATVTERLNGLLDQKYDNQEQFFDIPESTSSPKIPISKNFRILATCNIDKISKMSPALLNRFDIIVLENQIDDNIDKSQFETMIKIILDRNCLNASLKTEFENKVQEEQESDDDFDQLFVFHEENSDNDSINDDDKKDEENLKEPFKYSENIISLIYKKLENKRNISYISRICKSIIKLSSSFHQNESISEDKIIDFVFHLFENNSNRNYSIPVEIEEALIKMLHSHGKSNDAPFFYLESAALKSFFAKLMAYSLIEQPVCITGPTGVGKTSASRAFSMIRPCKSNDPFGFQFHSFHSGTKVSHFFGTTVLSNGEIQFHDGTLTTALKKGLVFIADEFNLSTQSVMKSLALALDPTIGRNAFIPGTGQNISISSEFFFIACQNEIGTIGRNAIPDTILRRFVEIDYPEPENEDIQNICVEIAKDNLPDDRKKYFKENDIRLAKNIGYYMIQLNSLKLTYIPQWSLRDITKLFKRIYNQENNQNFIRITPYHHILFYTLSSVSPKDAVKIIDNIKTIMNISFVLDEKSLNNLFECYLAEPEIKEFENQGYFIMKKDAGISIENLKKVLIDKELPSLWNTIFKVSLADEREPILLMGNSGFKTFLASQFLPSAQIISLNQETTVAQLLGTSGFMTVSEAKIFYIEYICKILQQDSKLIEIRDKWENKTLSLEEIDKLVLHGIRSNISRSFYYALNHLKEMLFSDSNEHNKESILSNTIIEFRPGLFFDAILQKQSLILKDLSNLPTIVLERFNELFSGRQNLTLSEDIHNTFTPENEKELTDFNTTFRVFATCPSNSPTKLSEAVLSRFSVIYVPEYKLDEQEIVLKSYIHNNTQFDPSYITKLTEFAEIYKQTFKRYITFPQMIKIIELTTQINKITSVEDQNHNLGIVLYRFLGGLMESKNSRNILFKQINIKSFDLPEIYNKINNNKDIQDEECILSIETKFDTNGISSKMSNLFIKNSSAHESQSIVAFTNSFNDLLDLIHLSLTIHNPILLEGPPGQGKHTAINFIAEMLNIDVVQITISQSTKVEDLFGKESISRKNDEIHIEMVETKFVNIIKSGFNYDKKSLIILENINNASPAVLNALVPIFNTNSTRILLPNGTTIEKGQFDIIGIINTQYASSCKDKLPSSLINSSFYHIVSKPNQNEILSIILTKFMSEGFTQEEAIRFNDYFNKARKIYSNEGNSFELFSLNDIKKYLLFRSFTKECFDETTILQMIFAYRFSTDEMIQTILKHLKLETMKFNPMFNYSNPPTQLFIRMNNSQDDNNNSNKDYKKCISLRSEIKDISVLSKINALTLPQKHCLIFLACSLLSKRACVIQGDTASGKSYIIRLFSELLGVKLIVFQMNNDSNISMLAGQSILNNSISKSDKIKFKNAFDDLCIDPTINDYFNDPSNKINKEDPSSWNPKVIKNLLNFINTIESSINNTENWPKIQKAIQIVKETMNPINRFQHQKSEFINAILNGYWVLIDGIESAPSAIAEKISSLCGEKPELNLFEYGPDYYFSSDSNDPKNKIHENFHLFITYNPHTVKESQMIDQTFLTKSVTFTLPQIDERVENSAQILFGSLINQSYSTNLSKELASRLAIMHEFARSESLINLDNFAGDIPYHGRILTFAIKAFEYWKKETKKITDISKPICFLINSFYLNSFLIKDDLEKFKSNCIQKFKQPLKYEIVNSIQTSNVNLRERNESALLVLRNIQKDVLNKEDFKYSFMKLLKDLSSTRISDITYVQKHIKSTIEIINSDCESTNDHLIKYGTLYIVHNIFKLIENPTESIKMEHTFLTLKDKELRNDKSILKPLSKLDLLNNLLLEKLFSEESSILLGNKLYLESILSISEVVRDQQINSIFNLFKFIQQNYNSIDFIDKVFPYQFFKKNNLSFISYLIPLVKHFIQQNICFSLTFDTEQIEFNCSSKIDLSIHLIMNDDNKLSFSKGSKIKYDKGFMDLPPNNDVLLFYTFVELVNKIKNEKIDFKSIFKSCLSIAKNTLKNSGGKCPCENNILPAKELFINQNDSIISMFWNLVFSFPASHIEAISLILNPIESQILTAILIMFNSVDQVNINDIIKWCKWAEFLEKYTIISLKCILNKSDTENDNCPPNVDLLMTNIKKEINYLKRSPDKSNKFWNSKYIIEYCEKEYNRLKRLKAQKDHQEHELEIQENLKELSILLANKKIQEKYIKMRNEIVNLISNIDEFTDEEYQLAKSIVDQFIEVASSNSKNKEKIYINWPIENTAFSEKNLTPTKNIKLFELLIWYSKILSILNEINDKKDIMSNLRKLGDFPEMAYLREMLLTHLIQNSRIDKSSLSLNDKNEARYLLEAHMLAKLFNIDDLFIKNNKNIYNAINNYAKRSNCNTKEIQWIYGKTGYISPDFTLSMPKIEPNALVFLVVNKISDNQFQHGPLFSDDLQNLDMVFFNDQASLMHTKFSSYREAAKSIAQNAYCTLVSADNPLDNYDSLKSYFVDENHPEINQYAYRVIRFIFYFAENLENWSEQKLIFDDISFLRLEWNQLFTNNDLLNKYPSLLFWVCKNEQCAKQLIKSYKNFKPNENQMPLWLIFLRILSSMQCIKFESNSQNKILDIINEVTTDIIIDYLKKSDKRNYNWLNLLISNIPQEIANNDIKIIHDFLNLLILDNYECSNRIIQQKKHYYIKESITTVFKLILSDKTQELLNSDISISSLIVNFLTHPSKYIQNCINQEFTNTSHSIISEKSYVKLDKFLKTNENLNTIIEELKKSIIDDETEFNESYEEQMEKLKEKEKEKKISDLKQKIDQYNEIIYKLRHSKIDRKKINDAINILNGLINELNIYKELFEIDDGHYIYRIKYHTCVTISRKDSPPIQLVDNSNNPDGICCFLLNNEYIDEKFSAGVQSDYWYYPFIKEEYRNNSDNVAEIIEPDFNYSIVKPILVFGKHNSKNFIKDVEALKTSLNRFDIKFCQVLRDKKPIYLQFFDIIPNIEKFIQKIKPNLKVEFSSKAPAPKTKEIIQGKLTPYLDNLGPLLKDLQKLVVHELKQWYQASSNNQIQKLFQYNYDFVELSNREKSNKLPDFSSLSDIKSLASPIFCLSSDNHIICSVDKLKCQIGPIFPSLTSSQSISINLISFIEGEVLLSFDQLPRTQISNLLKTKGKLLSNEPVQIFIKPPELTSKKDEIISLKGNLKIETKGIQPFLFPFDITISLLPLKMRLRCFQYPLSELKNNYFRLCCTRINSGQTIDIELINYYIHDQFALAVELESLEENKAQQPIKYVDKSKRCISLTMPQVNEPTRCQFDLILKHSRNFESKILCDFIITPIDFVFEMYDYYTKEFTSNNCHLIVNNGLSQKLYFRVLFHDQIKEKGNITLCLPKFIKEHNHSIYLSDNFNIDSDFYFDVEVYTSIIPSNINLANNYNSGITLKIANTPKSIKFNLIDPLNMGFYVDIDDEKNTDYLLKFPCYSYLHENKNWERVNNNKEMHSKKNIDVPYIFVSPFKDYTNKITYTNIQYDLNGCGQIAVANTYNTETVFIHACFNRFNKDFINISYSQTKVKDKYYVYYSIIGYIKEDMDNWFPVFDKYPNIKNITKLPYECIKSNVEKANTYRTNMFNNLKCDYASINSEYSSNFSNIKETNSAILLALLYSKSVVVNIEYLINEFPPILKKEFTSILKEIKPFINKLSDDLLLIISNNLVLKFIHVFQSRYTFISSHQFCLQMPISEEQINAYQAQALSELLYFDKEKALTRSINVKAYFNRNEKELSAYSVELLPEKSNQHDFFLISENDDAKPWKSSDGLGKISFKEYYEEESIISDKADAITSLPSISQPTKKSIASYNLFFLSCAQGASVLPTVIRSRRINKLDQEEPEKYFLSLLNIYTEIAKVSVSNKSILSSSINRFTESFKNCVKRLRRAGANFNGMNLHQSLTGSSNYSQDFIWIPENESPTLPQISWKIKNKNEKRYTNINDDSYFEMQSLHIEENTNITKYNISNPNPNLNNNKNDNHIFNSLKIDHHLSSKQKRVIMQKVAIDIPDDIQDDIPDDITDVNDDSSIDDNQPVFHIEATNSNTIDVKSEIFDSICNQIKEIDILKFIVNRISKTDPNNELEFSDSWNSKNYDIQNQEQLFETEDNNFPVSNLIDKLQYLITKLIAAASDSNCNFTSISCNLLIDCSNIISNECKIFNFMLLASFSYALSALEIPFTISIIADQNFRFVMKSYEENISIKILQRVLDCLFIKRYRANIADTFHHVLKVMKNPSRTQRAIFIFTDGLDENLILTKSWKNLVLNDSNNSFGLIFTQSKLLDDPKYEIVKNMWKKFMKESKTALSTTRLIYTKVNIGQTTINKIISLFVDVLSSPSEFRPNKQEKINIKPIFNINYDELAEDEFRKIERIMKFNLTNFKSPIFRKTNHMSFISGIRFEKLDVNYYRNKTGKIASALINKSIKDDFDHFILQNMFSNKSSFRQHLESIFKPNKASQTVLSNTGTDFDITALIMNLINPVPDPLIYLEEKGGLTRNYGVSIIIDSSISCFNQISSFHSYQTIKVLFSALESVEIPCVDVIVATNGAPIILCSEIPSKRLFNRKSTFWPAFFSTLSMNLSSPCNLESAIHAAYDLRRMRSVDSTSYMFVLTDGLFEKEQMELIKNHVVSCVQNGIAVFGIGIGVYPIGINELFPNVIFSPNPNYLINGIASFFDYEAGESYDNAIKVIMPEALDSHAIAKTFQQLISNENKPVFKDLKSYLSDTFVGMDAFSHVYNKEQKKLKNTMNQLINQEGEMYEKDLFKGQQILIVMPYDANMNMKENPKLLPENLFKSDFSGQSYVKHAVEFYGIDIKVVQNYKDAIYELTKKTKSGKCDYYAIWILSGLPYNVPLADSGNQHLVYQFIQCALQFWEKGGAVVLFAEGDPLTFQANLFLKMITFPGKQTKTKLQLSHVHEGKKILIADETGLLDKPGTFNKSPNEYNKFQRAPLGHNIFQIYEGETISFAEDVASIYSPFIPFMRDSEGGISALFYPGDKDQANKRGDIIIDCGYSKLFDAMTTEGTFKYVQNIASWTAQYESRFLSMPNPEKFRPDTIVFQINESIIFNGFLKIPTNSGTNVSPSTIKQRLFAIDCSGSVDGNDFYFSELYKIYKEHYKKGDKFIKWSSSYELITKKNLAQLIANKTGSGGTYPSNIIDACLENSSITRDHLILITDGRVNQKSIAKSDILIKRSKLQFKYVTTYIIGTKGDLSVGAPFARGCGSKTIHITPVSRKVMIGANQQDFSSLNEIDKISNVDMFNQHFDSLFNATKQQMIGTDGDPDLRKKFERMNERIIYHSGNTNSDINRKIRALIRMASGAISNVFDNDQITAMKFE